MSFKQVFKRVLPVGLMHFISDKLDRTPRIIYNIGLASGIQPKVFVSYVNGFLFVDNPYKCHGTRDVECASLVAALAKKGCRVDVARFDCQKGIRSDYDYIIGQGEAFRLATVLNPQAKRILYLTENPPALSLEKEKERISYFEERHHRTIGVVRSGLFFKDEDFEHLESCVFLGNPSDADKIKGIKTYTIRPTGINNLLFKLENRNYEKAKRRFMWIGSSGAVHKGLDILLDVFKSHPSLELYVLGLNEADRRQLKELMSPNIKNCGYIKIQGEEFARLVKECGFVVLPSCSERLATSVITGMNHGLIPLVTRETSIEAPVGEVFADFKVETVEETILRWSNKDIAFLEEESNQTRKFAFATYSYEQYAKRMGTIIDNIIK